MRRKSRFRTVGIEHHQTYALLLGWANRGSQRPRTDTAAATNQQLPQASIEAADRLLLQVVDRSKRQPRGRGRFGDVAEVIVGPVEDDARSF